MSDQTQLGSRTKLKSTKWFFPVTLILIFIMFFLMRGIMLPFAFGFAVAYLLDPLADKLEEYSVPRSLAAALVIGGFFLLMIGVLLSFWPVINDQFSKIAKVLPDLLVNAQKSFEAVIRELSTELNENISEKAQGLLASASGDILSQAQGLISNFLTSGLALFNLLGLMLISPVIAYYLLRDWDLIVDEINSWLPVKMALPIREQASEIDNVLAGFVRGQVIICCIMGFIYGFGWWLIGLDFALILGLLAGLLAFIPFLGILIAAFLALIVGIGQWGFDVQMLGLTIGLFVFVQALEGSILTPKLVGGKVGLHPAWVLLAVFGGGEIMGFLGVLIAVPLAASIAVIVRFTLREYKKHNQLEQKSDDNYPYPEKAVAKAAKAGDSAQLEIDHKDVKSI